MLLKDYLPPYLSSTATFTDLLSAEQIEIDGVNNSAQDIVNQCFVDTATWGLDNWESLFGILTDHTKDIDFRRSVIKAKLRGSGTVTVSLIENVASSFSNGEVTIIEHPSIYSFEVVFSGTIGIPPNLLDLEAAISRIMPAHLAVTYTYLYTQWSQAKTITWAIVKAKTWDDLLNGRVV